MGMSVPFVCIHNNYRIAVSSVRLNGELAGFLVVCSEAGSEIELCTGPFPREICSGEVEDLMEKLGAAYSVGQLPMLFKVTRELASRRPEAVGAALSQASVSCPLSWSD